MVQKAYTARLVFWAMEAKALELARYHIREPAWKAYKIFRILGATVVTTEVQSGSTYIKLNVS